MCLKSGMAWADPLGQSSPPIEEAIKKAALHFKATRRKWPNFVRISPVAAQALGKRLDGLLVISDPRVGKAYRLLIGWSEEAKSNGMD